MIKTLQTKKFFNSNAFNQSNKKDITVIVTDSGLGGVSIAANLLNNFRRYSTAEKIKIVFFNSLAHPDYGYNRMPNVERKAEVFDSALRSMESNYSPDIILIACNTLSVVFPFTKFSKQSLIPVIGVVEFGINLMAEKLDENSKFTVIILGTETTINGGSHKKGLADLGIGEDRIITQPCKYLESAIQSDPNSTETKILIEKYIDQALEKFVKRLGPIHAALCCTHYEYSIPVFNDVLSKKGIEYSILNPNERMSNFLFTSKSISSKGQPTIEADVVSRCKIKNSNIENIGKYIDKIGEGFSNALKTYKHVPTLFEVKLPF